MAEEENKIILYTTDDGKAQVSLMSRDRRVWLSGHCDPSAFAQLLKWDEVQSWPGCIVGTMDYDAMDRIPCNTALAGECRIWNEGYPNWLILSNIRPLPTPIPCRGNVGMRKLPMQLSNEVERQFAGNRDIIF